LICFTTRVVHLLIPKVISFLIAHIWTLFKIFLRACLDGATKTTSSTKSPLQQYWESIYTPYLSQLYSTPLINRLNKIGDRGHPCLTPRLIEKSSDRLPLKKARAFKDK